MCGIAGIVRFDGSCVDQWQLDRLTDALAHRGPDGSGTYIAGNVGLGHRRLSIIDLSEAASQPMISDDGQVILIFNGEIYDFQAERKILEEAGHRFRSSSDTEVLLHLYLEYGKECLQYLRGMFAFAILDKRNNQLFIARDRVGKKPLKYFRNGSVFAFASELKALRTLPECHSEIDQEAVHHFLTMMYLPSPITGIAGIQKLPAAHSLTIDLATGQESLERYWSLTYNTDESLSVEECTQSFLQTFDESVRLRMIADVPVGAFLSGGIDSAAVVAFMARHSPYPVKTFSIGSPEETHNELPDAERIAKLFATDHHSIVVEPNIVQLLPELVATYEEPFADPSSIPTYLVARETRQDVTVALNGDGGDENFAGYARYPILQFSELWKKVPLHFFVRRGVNLFHHAMGSTFSYRAKRFEDTINLLWPQRYLQYLSFFTEEEKRVLYLDGFGQGFPRTDAWYAEHTVNARARARHPLHKAMSMDLETYLADDLLPKVDLGSMAHGLEARSPFLDHKLLELTATMPPWFKLQGRKRKWILKQALKGILPDETLARRKTGFRLPLDRWFRGELSSWIRDQILTGSPSFWMMFDRTRVNTFLQQYQESNIDYSDHVWALLWLSEWCRQSE